MSIRIVNHKKLEMTNDEYAIFLDICKSYDKPPSVKGEFLFEDLYEVDDNGIITILRPPSRQFVTIEIFLFVIALMNQQHLRIMYSQLSESMQNINSKLKELNDNH
jgi:hypothetical protein